MHIETAQFIARNVERNPEFVANALRRAQARQHLRVSAAVRLIDASAPSAETTDGHISIHA